MSPVELISPASEEEALAALRSSEPGSVVVLAGGTDLLGDLERGRLRAQRLLSLRRLPWRTHAWADGGLTVGATEPLRLLEMDPELERRLPALYQAITAVGSPALRRQASLGGNLGRAAPSSDLAPVLLALDAEVELVGPEGVRTLTVDSFLRSARTTALGPAELVRSVRIAEPRPTSAYLWQRVRFANDISQIGVAVAWSAREGAWRVSLGGVPPRAMLVSACARALGAAKPSAAEIERASTVLSSSPTLVSDRRATEDHRRRLASALLARAVAAALARPLEEPP
jgi:CO/xanthine dehydrogenase FAD-binding subunit